MRHGQAGEEMPSGSPAGHDHSHSHRLPRDTLSKIPASIMFITIAEPP